MRYSTQIPKRKGEVQLELIMRIYREEDKFYSLVDATEH